MARYDIRTSVGQGPPLTTGELRTPFWGRLLPKVTVRSRRICASRQGRIPVAFLGLLGRVLPLQLQNDRDNPVTITSVTYRIVDPKQPNHDRLTFWLYSLIDQAMAKSRTRNVTWIVQ